MRVTLARWRAIAGALEGELEIDLVVAGSPGRAAGELETPAELAAEAGAHYVEVPNSPLSKKWNAATELARTLSPDLLMILGSDDWITALAVQQLAAGARSHGYVGIRDMFMFDLKSGRAAHWGGYSQGPRFNDTLGAGRTIRADLLDRVEWRLFDRGINRALDYEMTGRLRAQRIDEPIVVAERCLLDVKGGGPNICAFDQIQPQTRIDPSELDRVFGEGTVADLHRIRSLSGDARRTT